MVSKSEWVKVAHGSFGSRNGQPWSRELAKANGRARPSDARAGTYGAIVAPSKEALRAAIDAQTCPWCGRGPFKVLASHTNKEHGVDRTELREMAGLGIRDSICSTEFANKARQNLVSRDDWEDMRRRGNSAANLVERGPVPSETLAAFAIGAAARVVRHLEENKDRDAAVTELARNGMARKDIAERFEIATNTVTRILKRNGMHDDGRVAAAKTRGLDEDRLVRMQASRAAVRNAEKLTRLQRFTELGGTWAALDVMATEEGRTRRSMAAILRTAGATVPDGRQA